MVKAMNKLLPTAIPTNLGVLGLGYTINNGSVSFSGGQDTQLLNAIGCQALHRYLTWARASIPG